MTEPYAAADELVRVYPAAESSGAGLVWVHGGGFAYGDLDMPEADWVARTLAARGFPVVSVDYRRAPAFEAWGDYPREGHHFPAGSDDVLAAWSWTLAHAAELRLDPARVALGGASAGANLSAGAVLRMLGGSDIPVPPLVFLAYPTLLAVQPPPDAALRAALDAGPDPDEFSPAAVLQMYENYLGGPVDGAPLAAIPGLATAAELADFPPVLMINSEADELRVSGEHFAATLRAAGRDIDLVTEPGTRHGHLNRPEGPEASASLDRLAARLVSLPPSVQDTPSA